MGAYNELDIQRKEEREQPPAFTPFWAFQQPVATKPVVDNTGTTAVQPVTVVPEPKSVEMAAVVEPKPAEVVVEESEVQAIQQIVETAVSDISAQTDKIEDVTKPEPIVEETLEEQTGESEKSAENSEKTSKPLSADEKKRQHDESEAKRKAEWEAKQAKKKVAEQAALDALNNMSESDIATASAKRIGDDTERLTRRNMKDCVTAHIQEKCKVDLEFARKTMHPRKNMINCFKYITRLALEYIKKEMEDNGDPALGFGMGSDVPDDLCYKWAEDYFLDMEAEEDKDKDDEFVPKPFYGGGTSSKKTTTKKKADKPKVEKVKTVKKDNNSAQMSLLDQVASDSTASEVKVA